MKKIILAAACASFAIVGLHSCMDFDVLPTNLSAVMSSWNTFVYKGKGRIA